MENKKSFTSRPSDRQKLCLSISFVWEPLTTADVTTADSTANVTTANVNTADVTTANVTTADVLVLGYGLGLRG